MPRQDKVNPEMKIQEKPRQAKKNPEKPRQAQTGPDKLIHEKSRKLNKPVLRTLP
jgi:hypothetical protein